MTASTVKSAGITGFDSTPVTLRQLAVQGGKTREFMATIEVATTSMDDIGDIIKMIRIPAHLRITSAVVFNDALDTHSTPTLTADIGFYNSSTGLVAAAHGLASAITTLRAANTLGVNVAFEDQDIANLGKTAWEFAGLSADPGVPLDVAVTITATAATGAAGTLSMIIKGTLDN